MGVPDQRRRREDPPFSFSAPAWENWGMKAERESGRSGGDAGSAELPPSPNNTPSPSPSPTSGRAVGPIPERASGKVASGGMSRSMVHRFNVDLSGSTLAVFNMLLRVERAKLRGRKRRLSARDLGEAILKIYLKSNEQEILEEAADEIERLAEGVRVRRRRNFRPRPLRPARTPSAPDAGEGSLRCE
jgi:hypothetical protein